MVELHTPDQAYKLAVEHFQAERYAEAEHIFRQLVAVSNDHESLSYYFGLTCCRLGKIDEGVIWLRKTLDINQEHAGAHLNLAVALHKLSEPANAMASLRNAARINPDSLCGLNRVKHTGTSWRTTLRCIEQIAAAAQSTQDGDYLRVASCYIICLLNNQIAAIPDILEAVCEGSWAQPELFQLYLPFLQEEIPEEERQGLVNIFNKRIEGFRLDGWGCLHLALLWRHLFNLGWYSSHERPNPVCLPEHAEQLVLFCKSTGVVDLLGYSLDSPQEWNERPFEKYILNLIERNEVERNKDRDWLLWPRDGMSGFVFCQQPHTEEQAKYCFGKFSPAYISAGVRLGQAMDRYPLPSSDTPVVAFFSGTSINGSSPLLVVARILCGYLSSSRKFLSLC